MGETELTPRFRQDLRTGPPDVFETLGPFDWETLSRDEVGEPYRVTRYAREREQWEREHGTEMPIPEQWKRFNRSFHQLFDTDVPAATRENARELAARFLRLNLPAAGEALRELLHLGIWNYVHRVQDAVWDPRGKRALFEGLELDQPEILFLGAADGYEAMQLLSMYPGGRAVLVDYDPFCRDVRHGEFPARYPFLGRNPATGGATVYRRPDFEIEYVVSDIRDLDAGREFDLVLSVGLLEHFPDEYKPLALSWHRQFLKPGGYAVLTTPRKQLRSKAYYVAMADVMNYAYRELLTPEQLGLYLWENGFEILRCGYIKAHNGVVARPR